MTQLRAVLHVARSPTFACAISRPVAVARCASVGAAILLIVSVLSKRNYGFPSGSSPSGREKFSLATHTSRYRISSPSRNSRQKKLSILSCAKRKDSLLSNSNLAPSWLHWHRTVLSARHHHQKRASKLVKWYHKDLCISASTTPAPLSSKQTKFQQVLPAKPNVDQSNKKDADSVSEAFSKQSSNGASNANSSSTQNNDSASSILGSRSASGDSKGQSRAGLRRTSQQGGDCPACGGRGFQIVNEELQPCTVCDGADWEPAQSDQTVRPQPIPFDDPPAPPPDTPSKGRQRKGGRPLSQAAREKIRATMKGRRWTEEHRRAISESMKGVHNAEHRSRISAAMTARPKVCSYCGEEGHNRRGCPKLHPEKIQKEGKSSSSKTMVVCSHCKSRGHSRRTCPQLQATSSNGSSTSRSNSSSNSSRTDQQSNSIPRQVTVTQHTTNSVGKGNGRTIRLVKGSQTLPRGQQSQSVKEEDQRASSAASKEEELVAGADARVEGSSEEEELGVGAVRAKCSYCGARAGHNVRSCPKRQEDEESRAREKFASLRGLPGVEEQSIRRGKDKALVFPIPLHIEEAVSQAAAAVIRAYDAGLRRQKVELLLPQAGTTSAQGSWPGGIRQQAQVAIPSMIEPLLKQLKQHPNLQGRMAADWIDESDCVGAWQNSGLAAVLFPTAESLPQVRQIARVKGPHRLMLIINPQWQMNGQVVSDFGFGKGRADAEKFLGALQDVYCLERVRIMGDDLRLLKCYPGSWQVHYTWPNGRGSVLLGVEPARPSYARLVELLKTVPNTRASRSWVDRVLDINNLKGDSRESSSSVSALSLPMSPAAPQAPMAPSSDKRKGLSLRARMQQVLAEAEQSKPASQSSKAGQADVALQQQPDGVLNAPKKVQDGAIRATEDASSLPKPHKITKGSNASASKASRGAAADATPSKPKAKQGRKANVKQKSEAARLSDMSMDQLEGYNADMLDRFGSVDGKPTRDLKLDPVLQLVKWRESIFGSRDSLSESRDSVSESLDENNE